ncbi:MAG: UvrD-helicase domain-containing protein [Deltaproteobacteria bacterium]|nr:UvrD-helicase domain-containing protein [Deltaproteobacteria bacterium]
MADPPAPPERPAGAALNPAQAEAVAHPGGPLIVFAGAGSGKTRVITYRIANLVATRRVPPYRILAVTFTNKAAQEMKHRLDGLLGAGVARDLWMGTFHAVCHRLLRRYHEEAGLVSGFVIYDETDQKAVMRRTMEELDLDEKRHAPQKILGRIHREKQQARGPGEMAVKTPYDDVVRRCFEIYQRRLGEAGAVDFEDLLLAVLRLAEDGEGPAGAQLRARFEHVLVDEFQDVNHVQYRLVRAFGDHSRNICVVGDDDQSIYRWRGADVRNIRGFVADYPDAKLVKLEENYRSSANIVGAALGVIRPARRRQPKELWTANRAGEPVTVVAAQGERDEAGWVVEQIERRIARGTSPREMAVFYRVHAQSRVLEEAMRAAGLPYQIIGGQKFFERAEVKDLLAYLRVVANPRSDVDLLRIINVPPRKIGAKSIEHLLALAGERRCSVYEAIAPLCERGGVPPAAARSLSALRAMFEELRREAATGSVRDLAERVLETSGYAAALHAQDSAEGDARLDNLHELLGSMLEYEQEQAEADEPATLVGYLSRVSLVADVDALQDAPRLAMMTVHAAKGLEFDVVFVTGMEEDLFPLRSMSADEDDFAEQLEEERRLCYVALTRARRELFVTHTVLRTIYGQIRYNEPSRFLEDLPAKHVRAVSTETLGRPPGSWGAPRERAGPRPALRPDPAGSGARGERYVEREPDADAPAAAAFGVGARVRHARFGVGVVQRLELRAGGGEATATVAFPGTMPKRIKVSFLAPA